MGIQSGAELDAWLHGGGLVVTASDRASRALAAAYNRARRAEGLSGWPAPDILDWRSFARTQWSRRSLNGRLVLNSTQEQALWAQIVGRSGAAAALLDGPRHRLAALAMEAHDLLCSYAPHSLRPSARTAWQQDASAFSSWLADFDATCREVDCLSASRVPLELIPLLATDSATRPPILLAGFDRILPTQRALFDAWGAWRTASSGNPAEAVNFYRAATPAAELAACALWCRATLEAEPHARILVVTQDAFSRRGEFERAFLRHAGAADSPLFEFSLGVPLNQVAVSRAALLLLRWLSAPIQEHELDWLLATGHAAADSAETAALQAHMRAMRRRGFERPEWTIPDFSARRPAADPALASWSDRTDRAVRLLAQSAIRPRSPLDWAALVPQLLEAVAWPGPRPLTSAEFQAIHRWQQAVDDAASLGFDGRRVGWQEFLAALTRTASETLFTPESRNAPIQIAGPAESAGLTADCVWFLGATEDAWPAAGATHPLLPAALQREAGMPHATPLLDWDLARVITARLAASAPEITFCYPRQGDDADARPSRLAIEFAGAPQPLPDELAELAPPQPITLSVEDAGRIPFPHNRLEGGASVLTAQSQCPFKAFATARLNAQGWEPAEAGLTAVQRGQLLHATLRAIWAGKPDGLSSHADLVALPDRNSFIRMRVEQAVQTELAAAIYERMPPRYLELEAERLTVLIGHWLDYEAARVAFDVAFTERDSTVDLAGLTLRVRRDRVDRLNDGTLLVIDYKTGLVSPKAWDLPRPDDVQLPLYAGFGLQGEVGGLVFARIRAGDHAFAGRVGNAASTLIGGLKSTHALIKNPFTLEELIDWRDSIVQLARDFIAGHAEVAPRDFPKTCERCGLQTLCRIADDPARFASLEETGDEDTDE